MNKEKELECILFCEFHPIAGPKIVYQVPEDFISKEEFDCVAVYIIPKPELQSKLITIDALDHKFIGCPISIENAKYSRNALVFNVCFVLGPNVDTIRYEGVVKKLAGYMTSLELEYGFLSQEETKASLPCVLSQIFLELNEKGKCTIEIDEANTIHLKCNIATSTSPCSVLDHQVPVFICNNDALSSSVWDITTQQILRYIDGFNHVQRIAAEADVEISLVRRCMQDMIQYKIVKLIPIFQIDCDNYVKPALRRGIPDLERHLSLASGQEVIGFASTMLQDWLKRQYSNVYIPTPEVNQLTHDKKLKEECLKYVGKKGKTPPSFRDVFMLYCGLSPGATVRDLCTRYNPSNLRVDERRLIQFGMVTGIIRRLYKYPVQLTTTKDNEQPSPSSHQSKEKHRESKGKHRDSEANRFKLDDKWLDGNHNYDEICCKTGLTYQELEDKVEGASCIVVIWK